MTGSLSDHQRLMRVITYACTGPERPALDQEFIARIRCPQRGAKGKTVEDWHPVIFTAATREDAETKAQTWWAEELAKERRRQESYANAAHARKAKAGRERPQ